VMHFLSQRDENPIYKRRDGFSVTVIINLEYYSFLEKI
jgi:hypothetical protein